MLKFCIIKFQIRFIVMVVRQTGIRILMIIMGCCRKHKILSNPYIYIQNISDTAEIHNKIEERHKFSSQCKTTDAVQICKEKHQYYAEVSHLLNTVTEKLRDFNCGERSSNKTYKHLTLYTPYVMKAKLLNLYVEALHPTCQSS